jgi:hypothetical protein
MNESNCIFSAYIFIHFVHIILSHTHYIAISFIRYPFDFHLDRSFGVMVWAFQIAFLILLVLRVASKRLSTNEGTYSRVHDGTPHNVTRVLFVYYIISYYTIIYYHVQSQISISLPILS